jgi:hypothetical protein
MGGTWPRFWGERLRIAMAGTESLSSHMTLGGLSLQERWLRRALKWRASYQVNECKMLALLKGEKGSLSMRYSRLAVFTLIAAFMLNTETAIAKEPGIKSDELISKHLASIGSPQAIAAAKSRVVEGRIHFTFQSAGAGTQDGKQTFASQGDKTHFYLSLPNPTYRGERFIFDGAKMSVADISPGIRSSLGEFIHVQDRIIREGLWGGVLSTDWALLNAEQRHAKLTYVGLKKIDGRELQQFYYAPSKHSDLQISLYFDPETFRHALTVYSLTIAPQISTSDIETAGQKETTYRLEERFSEFKIFDGLTLPTGWEVRFTEDIPVSPVHPGGAGIYGRSSTKIWTMTEDAIINNVSLDARNFVIK